MADAADSLATCACSQPAMSTTRRPKTSATPTSGRPVTKREKLRCRLRLLWQGSCNVWQTEGMVLCKLYMQRSQKNPRRGGSERHQMHRSALAIAAPTCRYIGLLYSLAPTTPPNFCHSTKHCGMESLRHCVMPQDEHPLQDMLAELLLLMVDTRTSARQLLELRAR